ncbi:MAG: hypothetical protein D6766_13105, partial [Verrucomicrobia bacterium]
MKHVHDGWLWLCLVAVTLRAGEAGRPATETPTAPYFVVVTGGELLRGVYADGHTQFLARTLRPWGLECVGSLCVGDVAADLTRALEFASKAAPLVIVTGGLGPTDDDITRQTLAAFTGIPLREDADVLADMERRFGRERLARYPHLRRQAMVPSRGGWLPNPNGTAVGLVFDTGERWFVALPGPPGELRPMVREHLLPRLRERFGLRRPGPSVTLRFAGIGESQIDAVIHEKVGLPEGLMLSSIFQAGRVDLTLALPAGSPDATNRLARLAAAVRRELGDRIYAEGDRTLEEVVLEELGRRGVRLLVVETDGIVGADLAGCGLAAEVVAGVVAAPNVGGLRELLARGLGATSGERPGRGGSDGGTLWEEATALGRRLGVGAVLLAAETAGETAGGEEGVVECRFRVGAGPAVRGRFKRPGAGPEGRARLATAILDWCRGTMAGRRFP